MCWGFPGDGWFFLIDSLCESIQDHIDNPPWVPEKTILNGLRRVWNFGIKIIPSSGIRWKLSLPLSHAPAVIPQVVASQIKEKFGALRFYYSGGDNEIGAMVSLAETISFQICEECGVFNPDVVCTGRGWVRSLCIKCRKPEETDIHLKVQREYHADRILAWETARKSPSTVEEEYNKLRDMLKKWEKKDGNG